MQRIVRKYLQKKLTQDKEKIRKFKESLGLFNDNKKIYRFGITSRLQKARILYETIHQV